ncbi:MAG: hypothetical protein ACE15B_13540 [Bryobacteraceae bacterium]
MTRRAVLASGLAAAGLRAQKRGAIFAAEWTRYSDPATEFWVYRLTSPEYTSVLPAYYQNVVARRANFLLFASGRTGSMQAHRMDLKTGEWRQLTEADELDPMSLTLVPDERSFVYCDGPSLRVASTTGRLDREIYRVPSGWKRSKGVSLSVEGSFALFGETRQQGGRLRLVGLARGAARTIIETPFELSEPLARPRRAQALYRQGEEALWLVNTDGKQNRKLALADGGIGPASWSADGKTIYYLNFPPDKSQLNNIREFAPDQKEDKLIAKTSQFVHCDANRDGSVFVGASRNAASPTILLLLRVTRREFTLCEHGASDPAAVAPIFSPDSQRVYFNSDRHGKPAIYFINVERLVEETPGD